MDFEFGASGVEGCNGIVKGPSAGLTPHSYKLATLDPDQSLGF